MPTKKPAKKRAPRMNWKARALHCEEVIGVQNVLAGARKKAHGEVLAHNWDLLVRNEELRKKLCDATDYGMELDKQVGLEVKLRDEYLERALAAEKHNAILLAERHGAVNCANCGKSYTRDQYTRSLCDDLKCIAAMAERDGKLPTTWSGLQKAIGVKPNHWQHIKSWAAKWSIEIACALAILAVFALASWYALRWGK